MSEEGGREYPVITGTYTGAAAWRSAPMKAGAKLETPTPLFAEIDPAVVTEELDRLGGYDTWQKLSWAPVPEPLPAPAFRLAHASGHAVRAGYDGP